ncbi:hypothetical protein [Streptomyces sp. NPDC088812]
MAQVRDLGHVCCLDLTASFYPSRARSVSDAPSAVKWFADKEPDGLLS